PVRGGAFVRDAPHLRRVVVRERRRRTAHGNMAEVVHAAGVEAAGALGHLRGEGPAGALWAGRVPVLQEQPGLLEHDAEVLPHVVAGAERVAAEPVVGVRLAAGDEVVARGEVGPRVAVTAALQADGVAVIPPERDESLLAV